MRAIRAETTDPVCGTIVPSGSPLRYALGHDEYVFCSSECRERFAQDTARYIEREAFSSDAPYTCPKDADVSTYQPGLCPKCGRTLEQMGQGKH